MFLAGKVEVAFVEILEDRGYPEREDPPTTVTADPRQVALGFDTVGDRKSSADSGNAGDCINVTVVDDDIPTTIPVPVVGLCHTTLVRVPAQRDRERVGTDSGLNAPLGDILPGCREAVFGLVIEHGALRTEHWMEWLQVDPQAGNARRPTRELETRR